MFILISEQNGGYDKFISAGVNKMADSTNIFLQ
jgi:hypothetical protein